jgi:hypothetical protein
MKTYGGGKVQFYAFLTSTLDGCEWSDLCFGRFTPGTHSIGNCVAFRAGLDAVVKKKKKINSLLLLGTESRSSSP